MQLAEYFPPRPSILWQQAVQLGVTHAVTSLPEIDQKLPGKPWDFMTLTRLKQSFGDAGLDLQVIETAFPFLHDAKIGRKTAKADEEIAIAKELIANMGAAGIGVACYNWMAVFNWMRTSVTIPSRGGARVTGYDHSLMANGPLTPDGTISEDDLWGALERFLGEIVPVAEQAGVKLAAHPDDPPISPIRGVSRVLTSPDALQKVLDLVPSDANTLTFCQGTIATMGADVAAEIRRFGAQDKIAFVHFRDVRGTPERFEETFHDDGKTDMVAAMQAYQQVGFSGPLRPDHVPTMAGEDLVAPGYDTLGRLYAIGYIKGIHESVQKLA